MAQSIGDSKVAGSSLIRTKNGMMWTSSWRMPVHVLYNCIFLTNHNFCSLYYFTWLQKLARLWLTCWETARLAVSSLSAKLKLTTAWLHFHIDWKNTRVASVLSSNFNSWQVNRHISPKCKKENINVEMQGVVRRRGQRQAASLNLVGQKKKIPERHSDKWEWKHGHYSRSEI